MKDLAQEIEKLKALSRDQLIERYIELFGKEPRVGHRPRLWKRCAWKLQEQRLGGLSKTAKARLEDLIAEIEIPAHKALKKTARVRGKPDDPVPGTTLTREWRGRMIEVHVREEGFEYDGETYRSLTAAARAITGAAWSGPLFFGLSKRSNRK